MKGGPKQLCFLVLLSLFTGYACENQTTVDKSISPSDTLNASSSGTTEATLPPTTEKKRPKTAPLPTPVGYVSMTVEPGRPSYITTEGSSATLECKFKAPKGAKVIWKKTCSSNCSESFAVNETDSRKITEDISQGLSTLSFHSVQREDTAMYYCCVSAPSAGQRQSCGTYLWVRRPRPASFLNMTEGVKNKIITAEGFLLLICAIGPGLFLLFRKRWENERLLQAKKKAYEEENIYEGLNLDDCSMYEDISRGLQATYQDIGNVKVIDLQVEKPEKP
ncbi:B-cell antigen receptor complex-associated protein alpha chain isoform X1 [Podarcis lilfordi]|uniref:B-cell antigen receptor complex-associated protein alpha chain isoform X1 n=1 Tax=Podarcis lilfordi TaxID=74358 RepID=A0AA35KPX9_9SAUR|nr:B-cell antigen receptor complex-associated protein alpha chain isoform X1 [Podarcis lilfordi]